MNLYVKDINNIDADEKEVIDAIRKDIPDLIVIQGDDPDPDVYLSVRVRTSKADNLIQQILSMGYATKRLDLA